MFGERLAELRKLNDDTQQILADKIGFSAGLSVHGNTLLADLSASSTAPLQALRHRPPTTCWV